MRSAPLVSALAIWLGVSVAQAQPKPPQGAPIGAAVALQPAPSPPAAPPKVVEVNDALLMPVPPPAHTIANWREVVTLINSRSPDLFIARMEIERSRGLWRQALALALTTVTGTVGLSYNIFTEAPTATTITLPNGMTGTVSAAGSAPANPTLLAGLLVSQPVFAMQAWYNIGTADRQIKASALLVDDKERTVLAGIADAIVAVVTAERVAEVNRVGLKSSLQTLELTQRKQKLGSGTMLDVVRAQQDVSTARGTLITGDESLRKAREALGLALGFNDSWGVTQAVSLDGIIASLKQICAPDKPENRADVIAQKAAVEIAERGVHSSYLAYVPTIVASTQLQASNSVLVSGKDYAWSIQGLLTLPIWEGGARYGTTRIAKVQEAEAKATLGLTMRTAQLQAVQSYRNVDVADSSKEVAQNTRDLAKEQARLSMVAFEAGTGTSFDLVTSQALARQAELSLAVAEFAAIQARLDALLASSACKY